MRTICTGSAKTSVGPGRGGCGGDGDGGGAGTPAAAGVWTGMQGKRSCLSVKIAGIRRRLSSYQSDGRRYLRRRVSPPRSSPLRRSSVSALLSRPRVTPAHAPARSAHPPAPTVPVLHNRRLINQPPAGETQHPQPARARPPACRRRRRRHRHTGKSCAARSLLPENSSILFLLSLIFRVYHRRLRPSRATCPPPPPPLPRGAFRRSHSLLIFSFCPAPHTPSRFPRPRLSPPHRHCDHPLGTPHGHVCSGVAGR